MKLYLHWLRHDFRRFRLMLGIWVLLIVLYACFLGWAHLHILTVRQDTLDWSKPLAIALGLIQCGFLFALFNSDPATGTRHFWKTRPPSGLAIAGVKLTLALAFFLILPLAVWRLMNLLSVLPQYVTAASPYSQPWGAFLFWILSLTLAAFTFAASSAADARVLYLRLLAVLAGAGGFLFYLHLPGILSRGSPENEMRYKRAAMRGFASPEMAVVCLAGGVATFLLLRRTRLPRSGFLPAWLIPAGSLAWFGMVRQNVEFHPLDESLPSAEASLTKDIRLQDSVIYSPLLGVSDVDPVESDFQDGYYAPYDFTRKTSALSLTLRTSGLPAGARLSGRWLDLKLTAPDGTTVLADKDQTRKRLRQFITPQEAAPHLYLTEAVFPTAGLPPFYGQTCTATGTVRLTVYKLQRMEMPVPADRYGGPDLSPSAQAFPVSPPVATFFSGGTMGRNYLSATWLMPWHRNSDVFLENQDTGESASLGTSSYPTTGFLINYQAVDSVATLDGGRVVEGQGYRQASHLPEIIRKFSAPENGWKVGLRWYQPAGIADIPVTLENINIPFWEGGPEKPAKALAQFRIPAGGSDREVRTAVRRAWFLLSESEYAYRLSNGYNLPGRRFDAAAECRRVLADIQHRHLPLLMELVEEIPQQTNYSRGYPGFTELRERIRELIQPADVPGLLQQFPKAGINLMDILPPPPASPPTEPAPPAFVPGTPAAPGK